MREEASREEDGRCGELLRRLAEMADWEPWAVVVLLWRVRHPVEPRPELQTKFGLTPATVARLIQRTARRYPDLPGLVGIIRGPAKERGKSGGRLKQKRD